MQVNAGVAYDYFFKDHTRYFFSWLKLCAQGARHWGSLSEPALSISKNISRVAAFCQFGGDIPYAFQSFKEVYTESSDKSPRWIKACRVVNNAAFILGFSKHHIFGQPSSILGETVETVTEFVLSGHGLYKFLSEQQEPIKRLITHSWDTPKIVQLVHKVSSFVLVGFALFSVDEYAPNLTIFFTSISLSSHFLYSCDQAVNKQKKCSSS